MTIILLELSSRGTIGAGKYLHAQIIRVVFRITRCFFVFIIDQPNVLHTVIVLVSLLPLPTSQVIYQWQNKDCNIASNFILYVLFARLKK